VDLTQSIDLDLVQAIGLNQMQDQSCFNSDTLLYFLVGLDLAGSQEKKHCHFVFSRMRFTLRST
jgi:hypothetical protein